MSGSLECLVCVCVCFYILLGAAALFTVAAAAIICYCLSHRIRFCFDRFAERMYMYLRGEMLTVLFMSVCFFERMRNRFSVSRSDARYK